MGRTPDLQPTVTVPARLGCPTGQHSSCPPSLGTAHRSRVMGKAFHFGPPTRLSPLNNLLPKKLRARPHQPLMP